MFFLVMANTKEDVDDGIKMISAIAETLRFRKQNQDLDNEKILGHIMNFIQTKKSEKTKLLMITAASKALSIAERSPRLDDKSIIRQVMADFPSMFNIVEETINMKR